ncbi:MAG TPA: hypothetical protein VFT50_08155 [Baekduia sp.]|nr:hypothetical protein [Baekduia sp.]
MLATTVRSAAALIVLAAATASSVGSASAATVAVGPVGQTGQLSAWGGHVVFSQRDPATSRWRLMDASAVGIRALPVPAQATPITADAGPDAHGRPAAVFTRCSGTGAANTCRIHELSLARAHAKPHLVGALARPGYSDGAPSIWKGRIAFGRVLTGVPGTRIAALYVQRRPGARALLRLGRGTVPQCGAVPCGRIAQPEQLDLGPSGLAVTWFLRGGDAIPQDAEELWRIPLDGRPGTLLDTAVMGECAMGGALSFVSLASPRLDGLRVDYLRLAGDCWPTRSAFVETGPSPLRQRRHPVGSGELAYGMARDGHRWWWVRGAAHPPSGTDPWTACVDAPCTLMMSTGVRFQRVRVRHPPAPPVIDE